MRQAAADVISQQRTPPGAGTDKTKRWVEQPGPCVIPVEPQQLALGTEE
jgi:hypothetical protein